MLPKEDETSDVLVEELELLDDEVSLVALLPVSSVLEVLVEVEVVVASLVEEVLPVALLEVEFSSEQVSLDVEVLRTLLMYTATTAGASDDAVPAYTVTVDGSLDGLEDSGVHDHPLGGVQAYEVVGNHVQPSGGVHEYPLFLSDSCSDKGATRRAFVRPEMWN